MTDPATPSPDPVPAARAGEVRRHDFTGPERGAYVIAPGLTMAGLYRVMHDRLEYCPVRPHGYGKTVPLDDITDIDALCQRACVEVEKLLGIYPNVRGAEPDADDPPAWSARRINPAPETSVAPVERLLSVRSLQGPMAYFAVVQHPFQDPPRLNEVLKAISDQAAEVFDGPDFHRTLWFPSMHAIERWLRATLEVRAQDVLTLWNTPREGESPAISFTSRYGGPPPERDFIDIDALLRNVAMMAWREAAEYERAIGAFHAAR